MRAPRRIVTLALGLGLLALGPSSFAVDLTGTLTFVGVAPCRLVDTRGTGGFTGQAGPPALIADADRVFQVTGTVPGLPTQCGIPSNAQAIEANFTVAAPAGAGNLRAWAAGSAPPNASVVNYTSENVANAVTVPLGPVGSERGLAVRADVSSTHFVLDVTGYYVARPITIVLTDGPGAATATTPVTVASMFSGDLRGQGHRLGRLIARWQNSQQIPACAGSGTATLQLVQTASCASTTGGTVLASLSQMCDGKAWLDFSPSFTLPAGPACLDLRVGVTSGTASWRAVELELTR